MTSEESRGNGQDNFRFAMDLGRMKEKLSTILMDYKVWITKNPGRASDVESFFKILAYLLPGRIRGNSTVLPELLYSTANVVSFWHDYILKSEQEVALEQIREAERQIAEESNGHGHGSNGTVPGLQNDEHNRMESRKRQIFRIQVALTILEYFEVFLEVAARKMWGDLGRWAVIFIIQTIKTGLRAALLFYYKVGLIRSPAIPAFDRAKYYPHRTTPEPNVVFVLKHSGRVIRKLHASPPLYSRDWDVPEIPLLIDAERELSREKMTAEIIHLARPLSHLVALGACGATSWKPWILSLVMDVGSLYLHGRSSAAIPKADQIEIKRRTFGLLLYLLRSPFYDKTTKVRLISSLEGVGSRIPLFGNILLLLAQAIPQWQSTYSYVWS